MPSSKSIIIAACLIVLAGGAYWYWTRGGASSDAVAYQTQAASIGRIESIVNAAGSISPVVTVQVGSEVSGLISELDADFNSEVKSGQVIARIDDRTIRARLRQTEADVTSAEANLEQQTANLTRARADLQLAELEMMRQRELSGRKLNSQADLDKAEANLLIAQSQVELASAQVTSARANIDQRRAQLEQAQLDLDRTFIRSPVDGTVINRQVDVGQTVAASFSAPLLFEIAQDLTKMQIEADVDEADIGQIREGQMARFTVDAYPNREFAGMVSQVRKASTITNNVVTYKVIIAADNPRQELLPGMTANVNMILGQKENVLRVNNSALRFNPPDVEPAGPGDFGRAMDDRAAQLVTELKLDEQQKKAVEEAVDEIQAAIAEMRQGFAGGGPPGFGANPRERVSQVRQSMTNRLSGVLSEEQLARFGQVFGGPPGGGFAGAPSDSNSGLGGANGTAGMRPGRVWVLRDGEPVAVRVLVGLSDDQYTEVRSQDLAEGDLVIVRLAR